MRCLFLIAVLVAGTAGCAARDWVGDMLVLTDVTGTWTGTLIARGANTLAPTITAQMRLALTQSGSSVTEDVSYGGYYNQTGVSSGAVTGAGVTY